MNLVNEKGYVDVLKIREECLALLREKRDLEQQQQSYKGKRRAHQLTQIALDLDIHPVLSKYHPVKASEMVAKWVSKLESRILQCAETVEQFSEEVRENVSYTVRWKLSGAVEAEMLATECNYLIAMLSSVSFDELLEKLKLKGEDRKARVLYHTQRGASRSTCQVTNVVEALQIAALANMEDSAFRRGLWGSIVWELDDIVEHNVPVWEDRAFEKDKN